MGQLFDILEKAADAILREDWDEFGTYYSADVIAWSPSYWDLAGFMSQFTSDIDAS